MRGFLRCAVYLLGIGGLLFFVGRVLPKSWFKYDAFPFRSFSFEKEGAIYKALGIQRWKDKLPDMSVVFSMLMPSKKLPKELNVDKLKLMIQETCIAEFIHCVLCLLSINCIFLWDGLGGWTIFIIYVLGNVPFNLIQRYNRPKLIRILQKITAKDLVT